ncbi:autotransporter outer membrane beta-barrel domain-containing protein [Methylobacterium sp. J-026]|nr:autotransporter outer membrane beta-barrel domain-containing protein [Methylobacterium sp. J-026]
MAFLTPSLSYPNNTVVLTLTQTAPVQSVSTTPNQTSTATAVQAAVSTTPPAATPAATRSTPPAAAQSTTPAATQSTTPAAAQSTTPAAAQSTTSAAAQSTTPAATQSTTSTAAQSTTPAAVVASAVLTQSAPGAIQALNALSGEVQASAASAQAQIAFLVQETIFDHLRFGESNGFAQGLGLGGPGLTGSIGQRFAPGTTLPATYTTGGSGAPTVSLIPVRPLPPTYAVWGQVFGAFGETARTANTDRLTAQAGGFMLGIETAPGVLGGPLDGWQAGIAAGYSLTAFDVSARQSTGQIESGLAAIYARGPVGPLQVRLGAVYSGDALDTRRTVIFPGFSQALTGKAGGDSAYGFGEVGYRFACAQGYVEPFVGGSALHVHREGFTEVGGASALTVFGRSYDIQTATTGLQGQVLLDLFGTERPVVARGLIGYRRAFGDVVPSALLAFGGGTQTFQTAGAPVARDALVTMVGLDWQVATSTTVGVAYVGQVGERAESHAIKGSFNVRW